MTHLTGPPRLNGILLPRPSLGAAMELVWQAEHITKTLRSGTKRVIEKRYRGRLRFGWEYLPPDWAQVVLMEIEASASFELVPRIKLPDDPAWASETVLTMSVTSDLPSLQQLLTGTVPLVVEAETVATYDRIPGVLETGGYTITEVEPTQGGGIVTLDPDGVATATAGPAFSFTFLGETYVVPTVRLGSDGLADVHLITRERP